MSRENVAVVFAGFRRFSVGDMQGFKRLIDPDVTATAPAGWPEPGPWNGADAFIAQMERITADWSHQGISHPQVVAEEGEWVVVKYAWEVAGKTSGIDTSFDFVGAFRVRNGLIAEAHYRWDEADALEAAGLRE
jgi:ketosteroid isomerase-like protein